APFQPQVCDLENSLLQARRITCEVDRRFASFASSLPSPLPPALPSPHGTLSSGVTDNGSRDGKEGEDEEVGMHGRKEEMQESLDRLGGRIRLFAAQALGDAWRGYQRRRLRQAWWCWSLSLAPTEDCGKEGGRKEAAGVVREECGVLAS
ncbi:hypothetical protein NGA_0427900, partial [Nannochloropsis gaditana CCMP526]|uniref:uncharacterized protein n=1 Tax=Nannochloropsis gaditana (strain CCMP526) TaxID=1093141 RepID=UPI00029F77D7